MDKMPHNVRAATSAGAAPAHVMEVPGFTVVVGKGAIAARDLGSASGPDETRLWHLQGESPYGHTVDVRPLLTFDQARAFAVELAGVLHRAGVQWDHDRSHFSDILDAVVHSPERAGGGA